MNFNSTISNAQSSQSSSIQEGLIDIYLSVKVRSNEDVSSLFNLNNVDIQLEKCNEVQLEIERQRLRKLDLHVIIEYIKQSIEIMWSLKLESMEKSHQISQSNSQQMKSHIQSEDSPLSDIKSRKLDDAEINDYEQMIQKLEADVRNHIRIEQ